MWTARNVGDRKMLEWARPAPHDPHFHPKWFYEEPGQGWNVWWYGHWRSRRLIGYDAGDD